MTAPARIDIVVILYDVLAGFKLIFIARYTRNHDI